MLVLEKQLMNEFAFSIKGHQLIFTASYRACNSKGCERARSQEERFIVRGWKGEFRRLNQGKKKHSATI